MSLAGIAPLQALDGPAILSAYQGDWRGSGEARPNLRSELTRITCRISAT